MNNSKLAIDFGEPEEIDTTPLVNRQAELAKIVDALQAVSSSEQWQVLKSLVFDGTVESLEKRLFSEATKREVDTAEIHRLNGQLTQARRYSDLHKLMDVYRLELTTIRNKLDATND